MIITQILEKFIINAIKTYPTDHAEDCEQLDKINTHLPFSVVSSDQFHDVNGKPTRGRKYSWGVVEVDNPLHCDFKHLRELVIR